MTLKIPTLEEIRKVLKEKDQQQEIVLPFKIVDYPDILMPEKLKNKGE